MGVQYIFVFLGGGLGAVCRYLATSFFAVRFGAAFPYGTLFVNVLGSFLLGLLMGANALSALWNVLANVAFGVAAAWAGLLLVRAAL